ncbi:MAG: hypothetical protein ISR65_03065 [Bacteriovoracaceae bacterium]|nr:hypothetical protein [Bacteriovoracaceae bacterium]
MSKRLEEYIFTTFGFPVMLRDVEIKETESGEDYIDIDMKALEHIVIKVLLKSKTALSGAKLAFLRKFLNIPTKELGTQMGIATIDLKRWESCTREPTGLTTVQENRLKYFVLLHLQVMEQKELSKQLFSEKYEQIDNNAPLEIDEYKY